MEISERVTGKIPERKKGGKIHMIDNRIEENI
jgi:hypothetical protein